MTHACFEGNLQFEHGFWLQVSISRKKHPSLGLFLQIRPDI